MDKYYVEYLVNDKWFPKTIEMPLDRCEQYIKDCLKESPRLKFRIVRVHTDVVSEYTGDSTVPSKMIIHCHVCDKVLTKGIDPIHVYSSILEDGYGGYFHNDVVCCSKECALSAAEYHVYKYTPKDDFYEYNHAGWHFEDES